MSNAQPQPLEPGLGTHDSDPRVGDIGYPNVLKIILSGMVFSHSAPLLKGLHLLAGQL
jgi:hypothetical protein